MSKSIIVPVYTETGEVPKYATEGAAGIDVKVTAFDPDKIFSAYFKTFGEALILAEGGYGLDISLTPRELKPETKGIVLLPNGGRALLKTGLFMQIPEGFEAQLRPKSGLALKKGITIVNTPGTIDSDYRGEIGVILINHGFQCVFIYEGMEVGQLVFNEIAKAKFFKVETKTKLEESERGEGGFGSTWEKAKAAFDEPSEGKLPIEYGDPSVSFPQKS